MLVWIWTKPISGRELRRFRHGEVQEVRVGVVPRVDKRILLVSREEERQRFKLVDQAKEEAGQTQPKKKKRADPYYMCKKWLHR